MFPVVFRFSRTDGHVNTFVGMSAQYNPCGTISSVLPNSNYRSQVAYHRGSSPDEPIVVVYFFTVAQMRHN